MRLKSKKNHLENNQSKGAGRKERKMNANIQPLAIQKYIKLAKENDVISFAAGLPDLGVLPLAELKEIYGLLKEEAFSSFQYQSPIDALKTKIQVFMADKSIQCGLDEILITSGAQQGIYLAANLWFRQNASLMVEKFVYPGFLQVANLFNLNYLGIPSVFGEGPDLNYMETILKKEKPLPFLYTVCNGNNPQSETWSHELRKNIALLAEKYNFIVVEDDPYGYLSFTEEKFLPMRAYTKNALYIGSFSKIIAPSLRVGWMVGDKEIIQKLEQLKDMNDLSVSNLNQLTVNKFLERHELAMITQPQINLYKEKRDCMIAAIKLVFLKFLSN